MNADDWPRFRGPDGSNTSGETGLPLAWSERENIVWKTELPGRGASSAITCRDKIFLTAYSGYGEGETGSEKSALRQHVLCLDRPSGGIIWDKSTPGNPKEQDYGGYVALHGYSSATPVTDGNGVYAFFGSSGVVAYDFAGTRLWTAQVGSDTHEWGTGASPIVYENLVVVNASVESGSLVGLNKKTGAEVWRAGGVVQSYNTPIIVHQGDGSKELVVHGKGRILGLDPRTGARLWTYNTGVDDYICPSVVTHKGIIYAICARSGKFVAVRSGGGGDVSETHTVWSARGQSNVPSPVYHQGYLYWVSDEGIAHCIDAKTGKLMYKERLPNSGRVYASVTLVDGRLFAVSRERGTFVLEAAPRFKQLTLNVIADDDSIFNASPVVSRGQLLLRSDRFLYCIGAGASPVASGQ
jgi:outer membrane protein assembly factor BamB